MVNKMEVTEIEKLNQLVSRTDMSGNEKVQQLIDFIDNKVTEQLVTNEKTCPRCGDTLMKQVNSNNLNCVNCGLTQR